MRLIDGLQPPAETVRKTAAVEARHAGGRNAMARLIGWALLAWAFGVTSAAAQGAPATPENVADFYRGKTIAMVVGTPAGGGYDIYARLLARHLGKHIPGNPLIIIQNKPGAGSVIAANYVYEVAPQDGTVILAATRTAAFAQLLGQSGTRYQATKLNWLGSMNNEVGVMGIWHTSPVKTVEDARKTPVIFGSASMGGDGDIYPALMNNTIATKFKIVRGYQGSGGIDIAMLRGEVQGQSNSFSAMKKFAPDWREKMHVLVQLSLTRHPEMPDIPLIFDYLKPEYLAPGMTLEQAETLWRIMLVQKAMGRPFAVGPDVPADRLKALRTAFHAVLIDPEFLADAERTQNEINPVDGDDIQRMLETISSASQADIDKLNEAISYKGDEGTAR
jgi:tripartite-type tricarboxylate transporter receptor subunit TctC